MQNSEILRILRSAAAGYVSGAELAASLGVSRTAVWKRIRALEREGYRIDAVPSKGYRLTAMPDVIIVDEVLGACAGRTIGREILHRETAASTNTLAMELAQQGTAEGAVVTAEVQTGGKGRLGRSWVSPRGSLAVSVVLRPPVATHLAPLFTLLGAVAAARAIRERTGLAAGIKWPNDILVGGRKVCGLLIEMSAEPDRIKHLVLGIGMNVNLGPAALPPEVRGRSTSLAAETGGPVDRTALLISLLRELDQWYRRFLEDQAAVLSAWRELNVTLGRRVAVDGPAGRFSGTAEDIDKEGRLIVLIDDGSRQVVAAGDVTIQKT